MFFLPTKEISGASSKTLTSAPGLAAMCSISHRLSSVTGKCTITSWAAAGEQLGVGSAPTTLCAGERGRARAKAKSKGGFLYMWFGVFWMHVEGEFYACMSFFVQGCLEAEVLLLCSVSMNKMCLGRYVATWSVLQWGKVLLCLGAMVCHVMEDRPCHWAVGMMPFPIPSSLSVVLGGKCNIFCWFLPKHCLPFAVTCSSELGVSLVFLYSDQEWVWCLLTVTTSVGLSLGGPAAPAAVSFLGQPGEIERVWAKTVQGLVRTPDPVCLIYLWKNKFILFLHENLVFLYELWTDFMSTEAEVPQHVVDS